MGAWMKELMKELMEELMEESVEALITLQALHLNLMVALMIAYGNGGTVHARKTALY
eukprot:CAMPEP_0118641244 /NCGR_PEP_ID=MMETSP0785-20121206/5175_1 /TAXON_ID=91992 /ORGANISM="Bolidomonas pacifica, Strain CCMP 1866" /LENGTH=56 /DNA_ID=CAMNT_0006532669 /DNA_START=564 /DNA_END=734 /DNA_ORIENTATION=+